VRLEGLGKLTKYNDFGNRTRDLPACSRVPQLATVRLYTESNVRMARKDFRENDIGMRSHGDRGTSFRHYGRCP
jgi:hypothetical protein